VVRSRTDHRDPDRDSRIAFPESHRAARATPLVASHQGDSIWSTIKAAKRSIAFC
jgi:hypothetical protein